MKIKNKKGQGIIGYVLIFLFAWVFFTPLLQSCGLLHHVDIPQKQEVAVEAKTESDKNTSVISDEISSENTNDKKQEDKKNTEDVASVPDVKKVNTIYISDKAHLLTDATKQDLLKIGTDLDKKYKAQIAVYTIDSLDGKNIEEYTNKLFREIGIGDKKKNNGVLILVAKNDHKARIEVGYGLEETIPDGKAGRILKSMLSEFKKDKYDEGIKLAYGKIANEIYKANNDESSQVATKDNNEEDESILGIFFDIFIILVVFVVIVIFMSINDSGGGSGGGGYYGGSSGGYFGGSSWSSGGDSGGSWGGGDSGGGGASGGW